LVSVLDSGNRSSGRTVGGNGTVAHDEDDPKAALANNVCHCAVFNISFLQLATASTAGVFEHEIIGNLPQNRPDCLCDQPEK
jgi:hypothetical protein